MNHCELYGKVGTGKICEENRFGFPGVSFILECQRLSGVIDYIPVVIDISDYEGLIPGRLIYVKGTWENRILEVPNQTRRKFMYSVVADDIEYDVGYNGTQNNYIEIEGIIHKKFDPRTTPFGRHVTDLLLRVYTYERDHISFISCIVWGKGDARRLHRYNVGDSVNLCGRIQSRIYEKNGERHIVFEVSVQKFFE